MAGRYHAPRGLEYNEFVGELLPPGDRAFTELHVRYGVKADRYLDWSITLNARLGDIEELRGSNDRLERRTLERIDVSDSAIRRHTFDPYNPGSLPRIARLVELQAGDHDRVDFEYRSSLSGLAHMWAQKHPGPADRRTNATLLFVENDRDVEFREGDEFGWVRNTVISVDTDLADMVLTDRAGHYFPKVGSTAGVWMPNGRMMFLKVEPGGHLSPEEREARIADNSDNAPATAHGNTTMAMLVDAIYGGDWISELENLAGDE